MINPDKYIRQGIIKSLGALKVPIYNGVVPLSENKHPTDYILIINQTKQRYAVSKQCYEWSCSFVLDVVHISGRGTYALDIVDDRCELIIPIIEALSLEKFYVKNVDFEGDFTQTYGTENNTVNRKLLTFNIWLGNGR